MAKRKLLKIHDRQKVFDIPADEDSLIRHYRCHRRIVWRLSCGGVSIIGSVLPFSYV